MRSDWAEVQTIGELLAREGGSIKTGPFGTALKASEYADVGVPLISVREIGHGTFHIDRKTPRICNATLARLPEYILQEGDIVFARKGGIERCALIRKPQSGWFLGSDGIRLRPPAACDARFIAYSLQTNAAKDWLLQNSTGSTMASLNQATIGRLPIALPAIGEQKRIADVLEAFDDRITLLRETNATLEAVAQALFKSWFVDFDPVHVRARGEQPAGLAPEVAALFPDTFEETALGMVPKGWTVGTLSEICAISSGKRPPDRSDELSDECDIPLYGGAGLMGYTSASLFDTPRIVTGRVGTLGKVHVAYPPFWASDNVLVLTPADDSIFAFCLHWVSAIDVHALNRGSTQPLLTQKDLGAQLGVIPFPEVLVQFEATVSPLYKQIRANVQQAQTLATLRDTLLPRLISGQLRLPEAEQPLKDLAV
ncbi:restriction endonuclease subunit S [Aeromonas rivipollensis]|uniref:restriction endonuclease subunit S n=1 Tax=Aeromonas rivipollensis TaxID=948519 RepID=UPI001B4FA150|nr:restriction endonuclease subunit S [Aeromonadaceae bacterium]